MVLCLLDVVALKVAMRTRRYSDQMRRELSGLIQQNELHWLQLFARELTSILRDHNSLHYSNSPKHIRTRNSSWHPQLQLQMLKPIRDSLISLTFMPSTSPSEIITGSPINAATRTSRPSSVTQSAKKLPSCQLKTTAVLLPQIQIQTSPAPPLKVIPPPPFPPQVPCNSPISHKHHGTFRSWCWRET